MPSSVQGSGRTAWSWIVDVHRLAGRDLDRRLAEVHELLAARALADDDDHAHADLAPQLEVPGVIDDVADVAGGTVAPSTPLAPGGARCFPSCRSAHSPSRRTTRSR